MPGVLVSADLTKYGSVIMKRFFALCMALTLAAAFVGCEKKTEVKKTTTSTTTTPGGSTTETETTTVDTSGKNPPPMPQ